ncbi:MAG: hypothetical protein EP329_15450 [Deltaproteobacteria bacterium]|nr:MAG: hypothetical protein EP329_15450 [Deltaproteobacteria bacterium]
MESDGLSVMTVGAIVVGAVAVVVGLAVVAMSRHRAGAAPARRRRRHPAARLERDEAPTADGGTLRLDDGDVVEAGVERAPAVELNPDGGTLRLVNVCPHHPERRTRWTCPYCKADFCDDCRRRTGSVHHCPDERCAVRAAHAVAGG